ncbi:DUF1798 family protein [Salinicoccus sp. ID82-1]|uniref:DUF1798 family protein n=1 Tax=Salinicoccus cyprini TaxID=2493691 RepID=A0A558AZ65_9STAP|nr:MULTISPECIES: DUF1798 family protein [Salinicoccus]MCG1009117.1 DUF1798 family protein [Salinicoccus sp. ID82-1]TVT29562.1 DUF1798 family protein [Salinicoccus cyprini]
MSRNASFESLRGLLDEVDRRYSMARDGYEFDFRTEIEPFLEENKGLVNQIGSIHTDFRFNPVTREKVVEEFMELLMACHEKRFGMKLYKEKYKFVNMWLAHAGREGLFR